MTPDFSIPKGDDTTINGTVTGFGDITGYTITFSAKIDLNPNTTPIFTKTATIINGATGTFTIALTSTDTDQKPDIYNYDFKLVDGSGKIVHTKRSIFEITETVT